MPAARVVTRRQLLDLGFSREAIQHRLRGGRLHEAAYVEAILARTATRLRG
jgi:hypothetical protein